MTMPDFDDLIDVMKDRRIQIGLAVVVVGIALYFFTQKPPEPMVSSIVQGTKNYHW